MQTIWKGTVSFGLVSIPVRLYAATEERDVSFRQVHKEDGGRIRYKRICEIEGEEVPYRDIAKGYELPDGEMVLLDKEDFDTLPLPSSRVIDVLQFVPTDQLDPLLMAKAYYLSADGPGAKPYVLLRDALTSTDRVAIVKVALRNREQLAAVRARGDVLVLQTMLWPDEVRDAAAVAPDGDITVRDQEVAMAESYIETLTAEFDPSAYSDEYRHALEEMIAAKAGGASLEPAAAAPARNDNVVDLMAALRASVEAAKARRGEGGSAASAAGAAGSVKETAPAGKRAATSRTAKAPAKKTTDGEPAGKATTTKAPARKASTAKEGSAKPAAKKTTSKQGTKAAKAPAPRTAKKAAPAKRSVRKSA